MPFMGHSSQLATYARGEVLLTKKLIVRGQARRNGDTQVATLNLNF